MNTKGEVWYISFPNWSRTPLNSIWAKSYGSMNMPCCNCFQHSFMIYNARFVQIANLARLLSLAKMECTWPLQNNDEESQRSIHKHVQESNQSWEVKFYLNPFMCNSWFELKTSPKAKFYPKHSSLDNKIEWWTLKWSNHS